MENKFEHSGGIPVGCNTGAHLFDEQEGHQKIEKDGELTKLSLFCLRCQKWFAISAPLEINHMIDQLAGQPVQENQNVYTPTHTVPKFNLQETTVQSDERSEMLKRLLG